jgi:hypothetical protein
MEIFFTINTYIILSQHPNYIEILIRRPFYNIALDLGRKKAAMFMASVALMSLAEGRRGVKDAYTQVD